MLLICSLLLLAGIVQMIREQMPRRTVRADRAKRTAHPDVYKLSLRAAFRLNIHRGDAWYVRAYERLPRFMRPWWTMSARVEHDVTSFVMFGRRGR